MGSAHCGSAGAHRDWRPRWRDLLRAQFGRAIQPSGQLKGEMPPGTVLEAGALAKPQMRTGETGLEVIARVRGAGCGAVQLMQLRAAPLSIDRCSFATEATERPLEKRAKCSSWRSHCSGPRRSPNPCRCPRHSSCHLLLYDRPSEAPGERTEQHDERPHTVVFRTRASPPVAERLGTIGRILPVAGAARALRVRTALTVTTSRHIWNNERGGGSRA
jgi:hypothetical protein